MWCLAFAVISSTVSFVAIGVKLYRHKKRLSHSLRTIGTLGTVRMIYCMTVSSCREFASRSFDVGHVNMNSNHYTVSYWRGTNMYRIRIPKKHIVNGIYSITHNDVDVMKRVRMYMGILNDFHGIPTTPLDLGYTDGLVFNTMRGTKHFEPNEVIQL
uniref:Uncharacterized protein n=1 Tax=viral metagenome TaxID=1070528 RepID=A0A6C0M026_9ZZZZ